MKKWTAKEIKTLKNNYNIKSHKDLCSLLPDRTWSSIKHKSSRLRLWFWGTSKERFWKYVNKIGKDSCWNWTGVKIKKDYGHIKMDGKMILTHRFSWTIHFGKIPEDLCVLHTCDNPPCVNPNHLFLGTIADNNKDRDDKNRQAKLKGENHGMAKLTWDKVKEIRNLKNQLSQRKIAKMFNIHRGTVSKIHTNKIWK